jgi:hypothetical protein
VCKKISYVKKPRSLASGAAIHTLWEIEIIITQRRAIIPIDFSFRFFLHVKLSPCKTDEKMFDNIG